MCVMHNDDRGACVLLWLMLLFVVVQIYTPYISHLYEHKRGATSTLLMQRGSEFSREWNGARMKEIGNECIVYKHITLICQKRENIRYVMLCAFVRQRTIPPNCRMLRGCI